MSESITKLKEKFKTNKVSSISLKDFSEYCKTHSLLIIITMFIIVLTHGSNLFYNNLGIDTQVFVEKPSFEYNWLGIGRYGLLLEKNLLGLGEYCPYFAGVVFIIFLVVSNIILYYSFYKLSNKDLGLLNLCIPIIAFTHPIFVEQFAYMLQCAEISFAISLTALSTLFIFTWINDKKWIYAILGVIGLVICFATYQSFVALYIAFCIFSFIMMFEDDKNNEKNFKTIIKLVVTFIIALVIYKISIGLLPSYSVYIDDSFFWGKYPVRDICKSIINYIKEVILGVGKYFNKGFLIGVLLFVIISTYKILKTNWKISEKVLYILSIIAFMGTPFYMIIAIGHAPFIRTQFILPFTVAFMIMYASYYLFKNKWLKYISILCILCVFKCQMVTTQRLYYTDHMRNELDIQMVYEIADDLGELGFTENKKIAIIGHREARLNAVCQVGETVGKSLFSTGYDVAPYYTNSSSVILRLFRCLGMEYYKCTTEQIKEARTVAKDMKVWPEEGSIKEHNGFVVVKISEDDLPLE